MYRIWFTVRNNVGGKVRDCVDKNGKGFLPSEALYVSRKLKEQGKTNVKIVRLGSEADRRKGLKDGNVERFL